VAADSFHAWLHEDVSMAASFGHAALPTSLELAQATSSGGVVEPAPVMLAHWDDAGSQPAHNAADAIGTSVFKPAEVVNTAPASSPATPFVVVPDGHDHAGPVVDVGTHAPSLVSEAADVLLAAATGTSNGSTAGTAGQVVETVPYLPPSISTVLGHAVHVSGVSTVDASSAVAALTADAAHTATTISTTTDLSTVTAATASSNSVVSPSVSLTGASSSISSGSDTVATGTSGGDTAGSGTAGGGSAASGEHVAPVISHTITVAPAPVDALVTPITPVSVAFGSEPVAAAPASPVQDQATLALAVSSVHEFLIEVPLAKTVSTANTIVVYDPSVIDTAANHAQAVTFDFSDGSHISLIGLGSELTYALQGHA
jgi:hypothetical protein